MTAPAKVAGKKPEIVALTGLRAWAAFWVVAHHHRVFVRGELGEPWWGLLDRGYLGVDLFFTLSGFVLAYNYGDWIRSRADAARFVALRLARIYPLHVFMLLLLVALSATSGFTGLRIGSPEVYALDHHFWMHLFLVHAWGFESTLRFNQPSWSISAEFFAYLCFPLLWAVVARVWRPLSAAFGALVSVLAVIVILRLLGHETMHVPLHHALVRVTGEFLAGCFVWRLVALDDSPGLPARATSILLGGIGLLALTPAADPWMALAAALLVYVLASGSGPAMRLFTSAPAVFLGRISYSIYMTHMLVLSGLQRVLPTWQLGELGVLPTLGILFAHALAIVAVAAVSYEWLELPARDALRRRMPIRRIP
ncbi:MAG: acyltransferase [Myxococcales bacterium]|nr:acyltransferase [Myxococcales bacterium]